VARAGAPFRLDKFHVTAGRLRAFIERMPGGADLQSYASALPAAAGWNAAWTATLPKTIDDVNYELGPFGKRGCSIDGEGGRTYWQPPYPYAGGKFDTQDYPKDVLDEKAIQCVPWPVLKLFCIWDGERNGTYTAHLATNAEITYAFTNGGTTLYPWGNDYSIAGSDKLIHNYSYATPNAAGIRMVGTGASAYPLDHAFYMAPPGRRSPQGNNTYGQADLAGNMLHWIGDGPKLFTWTVSWEKHEKDLTATTWNPSDGPDGYYAIGGRCARNP
jgi:formylglycine-generating enzyme required for sulfatase activity